MIPPQVPGVPPMLGKDKRIKFNDEESDENELFGRKFFRSVF